MMTEIDIRSILRLMSYPEWKSFEKYIDSQYQLAINKLKRDTDPVMIHRSQGRISTYDDLHRLKDDMINNIKDITNG